MQFRFPKLLQLIAITIKPIDLDANFNFFAYKEFSFTCIAIYDLFCNFLGCFTYILGIHVLIICDT